MISRARRRGWSPKPRRERIANPAEASTLVRATEARSALSRALPLSTEVLMRDSLRCIAAASIPLLLALGAPACADDSTGPPAETTGSIRVQLTSSGDDVDPDGYELEVEGVPGTSVGPGDVVTIPDMRPGDYTVRLSEVADNCTVHGANPRSVTVVAGRTTEVPLSVACVARVGTLRVTVATTGEELDEDGYHLILNGDDYNAVAAPVNGVVAIPNVHEGAVTIGVAGMASNCGAAAASPSSVTVAFGGTTDVSVAVVCDPTGSIRVRTTTAGSDAPAGFEVLARRVGESAVDGRAIAPNGDASFTKLRGGDYDVTLFDAPENCALSGPVTRRVAVRVREAVDVTFDIACTAARLLVLSLWSGASVDVAVIKSNGEGLDWLAEGSAEDTDPQWSPDGARIAFSSTRAGSPAIHVMNADGTGITRLTHAIGSDERPAWSPDGTRIAFVSSRDGNEEIYVMNADGSDVVRLTDHPAADADPAWSPDGTRIAFRSHRDGDAEIHVMNADGTGVAALTSDPGWDGEPAWSPDGSRIAHIRNDCLQFCYGYFWSLAVTVLDGAVASSVVLEAEGLHDPAWSPDGRWLAAATRCAYYCYDGVLLVSVETGAIRSVVAGTASRPSWRR
jgi:WD40 repeat protein